MVGATWRWGLLLDAQSVAVPRRRWCPEYLVATFFNNFLPSNIGGDVIRIRDTATPGQSNTLAATVVLIDRGLGLLRAGPGWLQSGRPCAAPRARSEARPVWLWLDWPCGRRSRPARDGAGRRRTAPAPLRVLHPEWVEERIGRITSRAAPVPPSRPRR